MSYQFDGEFIEKFYTTFTMLAYESNRRFYPVGEVVGPMDKYKFTRNEVDMLFFLNSCVDKKVQPQYEFKYIDMNILNQYIPPRVSMATTCRSVEKLVQSCTIRTCGKILSQQQPQNRICQGNGKRNQAQGGSLGIFRAEYQKTFRRGVFA